MMMPSHLGKVTIQQLSGKTIAVAALASIAATTQPKRGLRYPEAANGQGISLKGSVGHMNRNSGGARC